MKIKLILTAVIASVLLSANAYSDAGSNRTFSLEDCINTALQKYPQLKLAEEKINVSEYDLKNADGKYYPSADAQMTYTRSFPHDEYPGENKNAFTMYAGLEYSVFDGFSKGANRERAEYSVDVNKLNLKFTVEQLKADIYKLYTDVIRKQQIVKTRNDNLALGRKELERIKAQYSAGTAHIGEVYSQESDMANIEYDLVSSENDLNIAKSNLLVKMGLYPDIRNEFLESSLPDTADSTEISNFKIKLGNVDELMNSALNNRLDYQSQKKNIDIAKRQETIAKAAYYPTLNANAGWNWTNNQFTEFSKQSLPSVGLTLSIPIFHNYTIDYQLQSAKFQTTQAEIELFQTEQKIRQDVQTAFLTLESSEKQLEISSRALKAAQINFETFQERYKVGSSNITDYLTANNNLIKAQINRINAVYNYFAAKKDILFTSGRSLEETK